MPVFTSVPPTYVNVAGIAELFGTSRKVVVSWIKHEPSFPKPACSRGRSFFYLRAAIETWYRTFVVGRQGRLTPITPYAPILALEDTDIAAGLVQQYEYLAAGVPRTIPKVARTVEVLHAAFALVVQAMEPLVRGEFKDALHDQELPENLGHQVFELAQQGLCVVADRKRWQEPTR